MKGTRFVTLSTCLLIGGAAGSLTCYAQPAINNGGVVHAASYGRDIAQGSMFVLFGRGLGPSQLVQATQYPIPTALAGTGVRVTADGRAWNVPVVYTSATQVGAILPSAIPLGIAQVSVVSNGQASAGAEIRIVKTAFGAFTVNASGTGTAVVQNFVSETNQPRNSLVTPAVTGQVVTLWGTGLGPVNASDDSPAGGTSVQGVRVLIAGREAKLRYAGRSGCCAGVDQLVVEVPSNVDGCYVPIQVYVAGATTVQNITMAVAPKVGSACSLPNSNTYRLPPFVVEWNDPRPAKLLPDPVYSELSRCIGCLVPSQMIQLNIPRPVSNLRLVGGGGPGCGHKSTHAWLIRRLRPKEWDDSTWGQEKVVSEGRYLLSGVLNPRDSSQLWALATRCVGGILQVSEFIASTTEELMPMAFKVEGTSRIVGEWRNGQQRATFKDDGEFEMRYDYDPTNWAAPLPRKGTFKLDEVAGRQWDVITLSDIFSPAGNKVCKVELKEMEFNLDCDNTITNYKWNISYQ
ncbi:MAG: hypothetical protein H7Y20_13100 [Bryobacteraceae bacterium]|nr:hypothetical protein [Bryobacteraceae bacterium]